ncbi:putative baseplate assembly protein [Billgrantia montanilacus]|uniref:Putative baseplate assembly protein n=1 Tax=Billgrantia montanilacus TaxID=2282305 RepID=A0A368TWR8_9GAMM|nr:putative baseplate assembly protein [Halomonas montanilacus]RCV89150.1 putative baseplate assembly protein [Halomonas montanilacus]
MIYHCCDPRRRERVLQAITDGRAINGIDFLEALDREAPADTPAQRTLLLRFLDTAPALALENFELSGGERITDVELEWVTRADAPNAALAEPGLITYLATLPAPEQVLVLRTSSTGDHAGYRLRLVVSPGALVPPPGIDQVLSEIDFSFKVECPTDFDCAPLHACPEEPVEQPALSYLAKDYQSFRRLMLDRMAQLMPDWRERNAADLGITLVEALAYTADRLSYAQDAVATEAYLATARRRSSVRRHARLVDYRMHDGANARVWVQVQSSADGITLQAGTRFLTRVNSFEPVIPEDDEEAALRLSPLVFESLHAKTLTVVENAMPFYEWSDAECCLPGGATRATLAGDYPSLAPGDVLIFEERLGPRTGRAADADPAIRHAVRLTAVQAGETDVLEGAPITEIRWAKEDALPFPFCLSSELDEAVGGGLQRQVSHALGNVLLADHGQTIADEALGVVPQSHLQLVPEAGGGPCAPPETRTVPPRFRPRLAEGPISQVAPFDEPAPSAYAATHPDLMSRRPKVVLLSGEAPMQEEWQARPDLLQSFPEHTHFVVETEADGAALLRFGDNRNGRRPATGTPFVAGYRVGNGRRGNVGAGAISHVISGFSEITAVRNPIPASGGLDPESMEDVRQAAPYAYRRQQRAVTPEDYAEMARRHRDVQRAAATFRWNGHGHTVFVTVDRFGNRPVTPEFKAELREQLNAVRMAGYDLEIDAPRFIALEIGLFVCAHRDHFRSQVRQDLLRALGASRNPDGSTGFFHPDRLTFGNAVYLSAIYARTMAVEGVASVEARHFRRRGSTRTEALENGVLAFGRLEIARLDNDPNYPEHGTLEIEMGGGK